MYMSERHQEGLAHLLYGINSGGGFVALTGEVGTGKTTLCRCLLQQLPANIDIAFILNPKLNAIELLISICDELGINHDPANQTLKSLIDAINQYLLAAYANGRHTVLLIDEAQNLNLDVLEQIRLLTNLETSKAKLLQIVLVGQPELKQLLARPELRQLNQRITARYHLLPLSFSETQAYIQHRLTVCGGNPRLFKDQAIRRIYRLASGVPRIINILCDRALLGAYATNARSISAAIIDHAARETLGLGKLSAWGNTAKATALLGIVVTSLYLVQENPALEQQAWIFPAKSTLLPTAIPQFESRQLPAKLEPTPVPKPTKVVGESFIEWLQKGDRSLEAAIGATLQLWGKPVMADRADCNDAVSAGLHCLTGNTNWKDLIALDRPPILEFSITPDQKRYALLTGLDQARLVLRFGEEAKFPLAEVLKFWDGTYQILWQSPKSGMTVINPQKSSSFVPWLRKQLIPAGNLANVKTPELFDDALKREVIKFQRQHHLVEDGVVGALTLIHLDNQSGASESRHLQITD